MERAGARLGGGPVAAAAQGRRGDEHAVGGLRAPLGERPGRIEPVAVQADIILAALDPLDREPVDEIGIGRAADPRGERDPGRERLRPPGEAADRALDPRARLRVEPVGRVLEHRLEPLAERDQRPEQRFERLDRGRRRLDQAPVGLGQLGLEAVAGVLRGGAGVDGAAHRARAASRSGRTAALGDPLQPAVAGQRAGRLHRRVERERAGLVIGGDVHQPRREAAAAAARLALGADDPAAQLDRLLAGEAAAKVESAASNR